MMIKIVNTTIASATVLGPVLDIYFADIAEQAKHGAFRGDELDILRRSSWVCKSENNSGDHEQYKAQCKEQSE